MNNSPRSLKYLLTEDTLDKRMGLPLGRAGSLIVSNWIKKGLKVIKISDRRFFWESDVLAFFLDLSETIDKMAS
jgi:hypothetical protein